MPVTLIGGAKSAQFVKRVVTEQVGVGALSFRTEDWRLMPVGARMVVAFEVPAEGPEPASPSLIAKVARVVRVQQANGGEPPAARWVAMELERSLHGGLDINEAALAGIILRPPR